MKFLKYLTLLIALFLTLALLNRINRVQLKSNTGELSPYFKKRFWDKGIFYQTWAGDGLGGSYQYEKLNLDTNSGFNVLDSTVLNDGADTRIAIGNQSDKYFFGATKLPFNPKDKYWKETFPLFGHDLLIVTKKEVFLYTDDTFTQIENADANQFTKVGGFASSNELFTDKINFYEIIYKEVTNNAGQRIMKASVQTKPNSNH